MKDQEMLERIRIDPRVMVGKPVVRGTRLTVEYILNLLAHGATVNDILIEYKSLTQDDIQACIFLNDAKKYLKTSPPPFPPPSGDCVVIG